MLYVRDFSNFRANCKRPPIDFREWGRRKQGAGEISASTDERLLLVLRTRKPALQDRLGLRQNFDKNHTSANAGVHVKNFSLGLEGICGRRNFDLHDCSYRERVHHIQVASLQAQLADARGYADGGFLLDQLGAGDKRVPGGVTALLFDHVSLRRDPAPYVMARRLGRIVFRLSSLKKLTASNNPCERVRNEARSFSECQKFLQH